jgi:hypothetical protein
MSSPWEVLQMTTRSLEVLGVGSLNEGRFLVYFSDQTYATVSGSRLADLFPKRHAIPESVTENLITEPSLHAARSLRGANLPESQNL